MDQVPLFWFFWKNKGRGGGNAYWPIISITSIIIFLKLFDFFLLIVSNCTYCMLCSMTAYGRYRFIEIWYDNIMLDWICCKYSKSVDYLKVCVILWVDWLLALPQRTCWFGLPKFVRLWMLTSTVGDMEMETICVMNTVCYAVFLPVWSPLRPRAMENIFTENLWFHFLNLPFFLSSTIAWGNVFLIKII